VCGTSLVLRRARAKHMINSPRSAVREPHRPPADLPLGIEALQEWATPAEPPPKLKGFPGGLESVGQEEARRR